MASGLLWDNLIKHNLIKKYAQYKLNISWKLKNLINQITTTQLPHCEPGFLEPWSNQALINQSSLE